MFDHYLRSEYRSDIQGLRAIGAIIIMVFHIWFNKVSGGVDVFFVISGYLMTAILLRAFFVSGTISPFPFWGGVIKRVAPSAYIVLAATLVASYFLSSPLLIHSVLHEIIASALHVENLQLIRQSVDYLAVDRQPSPVQQFWALSIQIQFYLVFPFIVIPLAYLSKKKGNSLPLFVGVALVILASFIHATLLIKDSPAISYFSPLARIWEFFFGSLAFLVVSHMKAIRARTVLGVVGVAMIIGGAIFIPRGAAFSGAISLIPVIGAVLVIVSGAGGNGLANRLLASKPLVFLGGISFTIYLWHWPIFIFYKTYFNIETIGLWQGVSIMIASVALAYVTNKYVEMPFRKIPRDKVIVNFSIGVLFFIPVVAAAFAFRYEVLATTRATVAALEDQIVTPFDGDGIYPAKQAFVPDRNRLLTIKQRVPAAYKEGCNQSATGTEVTTCDFGDVDADETVVLVGGSHAAQWITVLDEIGKKHQFKVVNMTKAECPLGVLADSNASCQVWNQAAIDKIITMQPAAVITNATRTQVNDAEIVPKSYVDSWKAIASHGIEVIGVRDNPRFDFDVPECLYRQRNAVDPNSCAIERAQALAPINPATRYQDTIQTIDMSEMFCTTDQCLTHFSDKIMYRDSNHISIEYAYFIQDNFEKKLMPLLER